MAELISVRSLVERKNPALAARIPAVVYWALERVAHVRELNDFVGRTQAVSPGEALGRALDALGMSYRVSAVDGRRAQIGHVRRASAEDGDVDAGFHDAELKEIFPSDDGRITVVSNHPHGGADALVVLDLLSRRYGHALVLANDLLQVMAPLAPFFVPINKHGTNLDHFRRIDAVFSSEAPIVIFPAGRTGRPSGGGLTRGPIVDFPWAKTFVKKSRAHRRRVVPLHIRGRNSRLFYTVAWLRTRLRIRMNLEMLLLVDELVKQRGSTLDLVVAPAFDAERLDGSRSDRSWASLLRRYVHALGDGTRQDFLTWADAQRIPASDMIGTGHHHGLG